MGRSTALQLPNLADLVTVSNFSRIYEFRTLSRSIMEGFVPLVFAGSLCDCLLF
jgi:hypothetical protein